ncbi:MAG: hypothetical protein GY701_12670 [Sulfitobacter sp.]|nr:hypothetical protein [Sulfitobacter sp.]
MRELEKEVALSFLDSRAVSQAQIQVAEKKSAREIAEEMANGTFPQPTGKLGRESYWRLGDILRWRKGWA